MTCAWRARHQDGRERRGTQRVAARSAVKHVHFETRREFGAVTAGLTTVGGAHGEKEYADAIRDSLPPVDVSPAVCVREAASGPQTERRDGMSVSPRGHLHPTLWLRSQTTPSQSSTLRPARSASASTHSLAGGVATRDTHCAWRARRRKRTTLRVTNSRRASASQRGRPWSSNTGSKFRGCEYGAHGGGVCARRRDSPVADRRPRRRPRGSQTQPSRSRSHSWVEATSINLNSPIESTYINTSPESSTRRLAKAAKYGRKQRCGT